MKHNLSATSPRTLTRVASALILLSTSSLTSHICFAEDSVKLSEDGSLELSITANRRLQALDKTLAPVSVISREEIESIQAQDVIDVLRLQAGIDISRNGGTGSQSSVLLRGSESDQLLVLIDGVRVSSVTTGSFDWSSLSVDQIERIEIVRGPRTALYGSDAIGGIIQVFTRKDTAPYATLTVGKYGTTRSSAGFSRGLGKSNLSLNLATEESNGFSATNAKAGEFTFDPDKDSHDKRSASLAFSHQLTDSTKAGINAFYSNNKVDFDQGDSDADLQTINAYLQMKVSEKWSHSLDISRTDNELVSTSSFGVSKFDTKRQALNWQNDLNLSASTSLILGANYREDTGTSADFDEEITNKAIYANLNNKRGALNFDLAARYDNHSQAGGELTGQFATGFEISPTTTAYASYGTAFKAPTINELFSPGFFGSFAGNPDLDPEKSETFELGLKSRVSKKQRLEANIFHSKIEDLISFTGDANQAVNNEEVILKGIELSYTGKTNKMDWQLAATLQRTENDSTGERLIRRPNNKLSANLGYSFSSKTRLGLDATLVSSRQDTNFSVFPSERVKLGSYNLLNLSLQHKLSKHTALGLRLENITDEAYELAYGFNTPDRGAYLTFSYR